MKDFLYYYLECHIVIKKYELYFGDKSDIIDILCLFLDTDFNSIYIDDFGSCYCSDDLLDSNNKSNIDYVVKCLKVNYER